jgi:LPXTG-motif cell wall-anchored protein
MNPFLLDIIEDPRVTDGSTGGWLLGISITALVGLIILFIYRKRNQKSS